MKKYIFGIIFTSFLLISTSCINGYINKDVNEIKNSNFPIVLQKKSIDLNDYKIRILYLEDDDCNCENKTVSSLWRFPLICSALYIIYSICLKWLEIAYQIGLGIIPFFICINIVTLAIQLDCTWLDS